MAEENKETKEVNNEEEKTEAQQEEALIQEGYSTDEISFIKIMAQGRTLEETAESPFVKDGIEGVRLEKSGIELETILPFEDFKAKVISQNEIEGGASVQETPKKYPSFDSWSKKRSESQNK